MRPLYGFCIVVAAACAVAAGCTGSKGTAPAPVKLTPVAGLPKPSLPPWIQSVSPLSDAQSLAQIRVIFNKPVTKVESLSGDGPTEVLSHVSIDPPLQGHFTVLTPRMIGFVADQALPVGSRVKVTLSAGLSDLDGDSLASDLAWTFETQPLSFDALPQLKASEDEDTPAPVGTRPALIVTSNAAVDTDSLAAHATLEGNGDVVPVDVSMQATPTPYPGSNAAELFDPSLDGWVYTIKPQRDLHLATTYTLKLSPGIDPAYGNVATSKSFTGGVKTYGALTITPTAAPTPGSPTGRFDNGDPVITFSNPLDAKSVAGAVTVSPKPADIGGPIATVPDEGSNEIDINPYALDPDSSYTVTIAPTVKDVFGQTLAQAQTIPVKTGNFAPGAWAPDGTSVIPASLPVDLNFYATNLSDNQYRSAFGKVTPEEMLGNDDGSKFLPSPSSWARQTLANAKRNAQSVVRVNVQRQLGAPYGALAYGFKTSLDSSDSSGTTGIAQLTNLGVFAQWFPSHGIVLVQHLSDGAPVAGATVTAYRNVATSDGSPVDCAQGRTNADGSVEFANIDVEKCYAGTS
ncbi:MAG: Ig-like domain-containing protein, partial [Candidatus Eremiobacteraeota bacterium]|nr:Ig-like domain-containing protein [Candidatus Eremiobacteraeota bacterium]